MRKTGICKMSNWALLFLTTLASSNVVFAEEEGSSSSSGKSSLRIEDVKDNKNKVGGGDIDSDLTNAKLRTESGSKSKYSLSLNSKYTGGSISRPFGSDRPNLSKEVGNQVKTSLDGGIEARYRWTKNDSITVGTSYGLYTPFQGNVPDSKGNRDSQLNIYDPTVSYSRAGKLGALQTNGTVTVGFGTSQEAKSVDRTLQYNASYTFLYVFSNHITTGINLDGIYNAYTSKPGGNEETQVGYYGGDQRTQWNLGVYPFAEYAFNDRYSLRTVFGYFNWKHLYGDQNNWRMLQTFVYQSFGLGISVTRDVYLYPNLQFVPNNLRSDFANVALNAILNVF